MRAIISGGPRDGEAREISDALWAQGQMVLLADPRGAVFLKQEDGVPPPPPEPIREVYDRKTVTTATGASVPRRVYRGTF